MYAAAYVNGEAQQKELHVVVKTPSLVLTAARTVLAAPGDTDTFDAHGNGATIVKGWAFSPDSAPSSEASVGSAWGSCSPDVSTCTNVVSQSGTVSVIATVNGTLLTARLHISVVPCPIEGESALNDPAVRHDLMILMQRSGWWLTPGDGIAPGDSVGLKRERAGDIYRRPDGSYYFSEDTQAWSTECRLERSGMVTRHSPDDVKVADVHTEPTEKGWFMYGCGPDYFTHELAKRGPWDSTRTRLPRRGNVELTGGGSLADWIAVRDLPENAGPIPLVDGYVLNADGQIWKLPKEKLRDDTQWLSNNASWRWTGNNNPSCNW
jgi:hypothetical protein